MPFFEYFSFCALTIFTSTSYKSTTYLCAPIFWNLAVMMALEVHFGPKRSQKKLKVKAVAQ